MGKYEVNNKIYEIRKEVENAIFKRYFEKRYFSTSVIACLLVGFLLGLLANQGVRMTQPFNYYYMCVKCAYIKGGSGSSLNTR